MAREEIRIPVEVDAAEAAEDLEHLADLGGDLEQLDPRVTIDAETAEAEARIAQFRDEAERAEKAVADIGPAATPGVSAISDLTGPLGEASAQAGELGESVAAAGELAGALAEKFGLSAAQAGALQAAMGPIAIGVAVAAAAWSQYQQAQQKAKQKAEELARLNREIAEALRAGETADAAEKLVEGYDGLLASAEAAGISVEDMTAFITGQTDELNLAGVAAEDLAAVDMILGAAARQARESFDEQNSELARNETYTRRAGDAMAEHEGILARAKAETEQLTRAYERLQGTLSDEASMLAAAESIDGVQTALDEAFFAAVEFGAGSEEAQDANRALAQQLNSAKSDVIAYAESVGGIPEEELTSIMALIDQGKLTEAEAALAGLERDRVAKVSVVPKPGAAIDWGALLGRPPAGTTVTINAPAGMRAQELVAAAAGYQRRNGRR